MIAEAEVEEKKTRGRGRSKMDDKLRVHIALPTELNEKLKVIQAETYAGSVTEVIKDALVLYAALLEEHKLGRFIFTQSKDGSDTHKVSVFL